ncbi:Cro/CI family transcriptional regulator (plasmid) [Moraxella lincolnii]|uniref:Cro/CI family transcriptional regulator n=1 Tax=Lwoffella lincolnii TaxID=90241 RepID=UPI0030CC4ADF
MNVEDLKSYFKVTRDVEIASKLSVSPSAVCKWRKEGIPKSRQAIVEIRTNGKLKSDYSTEDKE